MAKNQRINGSRVIQDLTGQPFERWTVLRRAPDKVYAGRRVIMWTCQCSCGKIKDVPGNNLRSHGSRSCGCLIEEFRSTYNRTHGLSHTPEYEAWTNMNGRCEGRDPQSKANYADKGRRVCDRFRTDFLAFYEDLGQRPSPDHSVDRMNNEAGYDCGKCDDCKIRGAVPNLRWATWTEQMRNTSRSHFVDFQGERITISEVAERLQIPYSEAYRRYTE